MQYPDKIGVFLKSIPYFFPEIKWMENEQVGLSHIFLRGLQIAFISATLVANRQEV